MMKTLAASILAACILLGCATSGSVVRNDLKGYGIVVGRFPTFNHTTLEFQALLPDHTPTLVAMANPQEISVGASDTVVAFKLKEGTYYIQGLSGSRPSFAGMVQVRIPLPVELRRPIVIKDGTVLYIGSFSYNLGNAFQDPVVRFSTSMDGVAEELAKGSPDLKSVPVASLFE